MLYSVRKATTGSFFAALLDGIMPAKRVSITLIMTNMTATGTGRTALSPLIPVKWCKIALIGIHKIQVIITPRVPDVNPIITVSALNILETFCFEAPIARRMPISLVLS